MRIGEFSNYHKITSNTVRHYLDMGLLATIKYGGQYIFRESDHSDMYKIQELKELDFTLKEIKEILTLQRLSGSNSSVFKKYYLSLLKTKKKEIMGHIVNYQRIEDQLEKDIQFYRNMSETEASVLSFPLQALNMLSCPNCRQSLSMSQGIVKNNYIEEADITCSCGYSAEIVDGIFVEKDSARKKLINGKPLPTKVEYMRLSSEKYINFMYQGMDIMIEYLNQYASDTLYIYEACDCSGFFLYQYLDFIPEKSTYILSEYDFDRLSMLKNELENLNKHKHFLFFCCDDERIPLADATIDILIDYMTLQPHMGVSNAASVQNMFAKLSNNGLYVASFQGSRSRPSNLSEKWEDLFSEQKPKFSAVLPEFEQLEATSFQSKLDNDINSFSEKLINNQQLIFAGKKIADKSI